MCIFSLYLGQVRRTVGLPGWAEKKDVLCLWQVNHLSFQSQTADLHPRQLVLILYSLHIQQALLSGLHHTYEYFITLLSKSASKLGTSSVHTLFVRLYVVIFLPGVLHAPSTNNVSENYLRFHVSTEKRSVLFSLHNILSGTASRSLFYQWVQKTGIHLKELLLLYHLSIFSLISIHKHANKAAFCSHCTFASWVFFLFSLEWISAICASQYKQCTLCFMHKLCYRKLHISLFSSFWVCTMSSACKQSNPYEQC